MQSRRNPWIGSLYGIAAVLVIGATYVVPRYAAEPETMAVALDRIIQLFKPGAEKSDATPEDLTPASGHAPESEPLAEIGPSPNLTKEVSSEVSAESKVTASPPVPRAKPIVTDQSVVAGN